MATDYLKMSEFTQKHSPLFIFLKLKICFAPRLVQFRNATHTSLYFSVNRHTCMPVNFAFRVYPPDGEFDT